MKNENGATPNEDHTRYLAERIFEIAGQGNLFRVVGGLEVLLNPENAVVDPDDDYIALHPRFKNAPAGQQHPPHLPR